MVVMLAPSACTASVVHDLADTPSTRTVHAPHWLVSQPIFVPVRLVTSRMKWTSSSRGSTSCSQSRPLTVMLTWTFTPHLPRDRNYIVRRWMRATAESIRNLLFVFRYAIYHDS